MSNTPEGHPDFPDGIQGGFSMQGPPIEVLQAIESMKSRPEPTTWDYKHHAMHCTISLFTSFYEAGNRRFFIRKPNPADVVAMARAVEAYLLEANR